MPFNGIVNDEAVGKGKLMKKNKSDN